MKFYSPTSRRGMLNLAEFFMSRPTKPVEVIPDNSSYYRFGDLVDRLVEFFEVNSLDRACWNTPNLSTVDPSGHTTDFIEYVRAQPDHDKVLDALLIGLGLFSFEYISFPFFKRHGATVSTFQITTERRSLAVEDFHKLAYANLKLAREKLTQTNLRRIPIAKRYWLEDMSGTCVYWIARYFCILFDYKCVMVKNDHSHSSTITASDAYSRLDSVDEERRPTILLKDTMLFLIPWADPRLKRYEPYNKVYNYTTDPQDVLKTGTIFESDEPPSETPTYGVELELSTNDTPAQLMSHFEDLFAVCKNDSSVSGNKSNKYEVVTVPASLRVQRKMWTNFFKSANLDNYDTTVRHTNGMHVHVGRHVFNRSNGVANSNHILRFSYFFNNPANRWFIVKMSERRPLDIQHYCNFVNLYDLKTKSKAFLNTVKAGNTGKMFAVNHTKRQTIEIRIFKGVVSYTAVMKNLELVDAVLHYTSMCSIKECNISGLVKWLQSQPRNQYRVLRKYLEAEMSVDSIHRICSFLEAHGFSRDAEIAMQALDPTELMLISSCNNHWNSVLGGRFDPGNISESSCLKYDAELLKNYR